MQNKNSETISDEIIDKLSEYYQKGIDDFAVLRATDSPYTMFQIEFVMYKYFNIVLNYDRGRFGCSILNGNKYLPLENSQKWYDKADMNVFLKELDEQIKLRIPDKFLEFYGWK
ncbi:hypothetical protein SAMN05421736_11532 [Evansella caseinilytica]|uniref:Uncharacterized protein n=1 Tax=Evansella caseinilytica TaxID=1503961 RepID=A0A1H3TMM8_9BACI|nr:hypothetical protein [Evansella caseinilytica]SDZ50599.1 hypothetical protein SAMN05421736_11532 [Evansella caseinilytica]